MVRSSSGFTFRDFLSPRQLRYILGGGLGNVPVLRVRVKWLERHPLEGEGLVSGVNDRRLFAYVAVPVGENREILAERRIERGSGLYLRRNELSAALLDKIDFHAFAVAVEVEIGSLSGVERAFHCFEDDQVLEESAAKRIAVQLNLARVLARDRKEGHMICQKRAFSILTLCQKMAYRDLILCQKCAIISDLKLKGRT